MCVFFAFIHFPRRPILTHKHPEEKSRKRLNFKGGEWDWRLAKEDDFHFLLNSCLYHLHVYPSIYYLANFFSGGGKAIEQQGQVLERSPIKSSSCMPFTPHISSFLNPGKTKMPQKLNSLLSSCICPSARTKITQYTRNTDSPEGCYTRCDKKNTVSV